MSNVVTLDPNAVLSKVVEETPTQTVIFDPATGGIRWYGPHAERALQRLSSGPIMHLHDVIHPLEASDWMLRGSLALRTGETKDYVRRNEAGELVYIMMCPVSLAKNLAMRIALPMGRIFDKAEEFLEESVAGVLRQGT